MVFQYTFSGTNYICAISVGISGWVPLAIGAAGAAQVQIQAAIDYVENLGGGSVFIDRGTYNMTVVAEAGTDGHCLYIGDSVELYGSGWATILRIADNQVVVGRQCHLIKNRDWGVALNTHIILRDIKLDGNETNQPTAPVDFSQTVNFWYVDHSIVENCYITDSEGAGILLRESDWNFVVDNYVLDVINSCIQIGASDYNTVLGNHLYNAEDDDVIWIPYGESLGNIISGNQIYNGAGNGVRIQGTDGLRVLGTIISNNNIWGNPGNGIIIGGYCWNTIIDGNDIHDNTQTGINILADNESIIISNNIVRDNGDEAAYLLFDGSTMTGNIFETAVDDNNVVYIGGNYNSIQNNTFKGMQNWFVGLRLDGGASYNVVYDNLFTDEGGANGQGIRVDGATEVENVLKNNRFYNVSQAFLTDDGTNTIVHSRTFQFTEPLGTAAWQVASPTGILVTATDEGALAEGWVPKEAQETVRFRIAGVGLTAPGAAKGMLLEININAGKPVGAEQYNAEAIAVAGKENTEDNFGVNDAIEWVIDSADDTDVDEIGSGETFECFAMFEDDGVDSDIETDAVLRTVTVEYV